MYFFKGIYWIAYNAPEFAEATVNLLAGLAKVTVILLDAIIIFSIASGLIYGLWSMVFEAPGKADSDSSKVLFKLIGNFDLQREVKQENTSTSSKMRRVGMLGTLVILLIALGAIYVIVQMAF